MLYQLSYTPNFCSSPRTRTSIKWLTVTRNNLYTREEFIVETEGIEPTPLVLQTSVRTIYTKSPYPFVSTCRFLSRHFPHDMFYLSVLPYWDLKSTLCGAGRNRTYSLGFYRAGRCLTCRPQKIKTKSHRTHLMFLTRYLWFTYYSSYRYR